MNCLSTNPATQFKRNSIRDRLRIPFEMIEDAGGGPVVPREQLMATPVIGYLGGATEAD
jgi:hypothetical protein